MGRQPQPSHSHSRIFFKMNASQNNTINKRNRIVIAIASILLLAAFIFPLWQIRLQAPQYPEGLGMNIWVNSIRSLHPHNIRTINDLNHYVGMKPIKPSSIPELKFMPYLLIGLSLLGLAASISGKRSLLISWVVSFGALAVGGLVDFYKWEYNYGHDLNPHAAIKIPGMSYQPPLIGSKQLLNINATSIPYIGGIAVIIAFGIGIYVLVKEYRKHKVKKPHFTGF